MQRRASLSLRETLGYSVNLSHSSLCLTSGAFKKLSGGFTTEALRDKGVPIPEDARIALRYFENPETRIVSAVGIGSLEALRKPNIVQEIASNPRLFAELSRTHPEVLRELSGLHEDVTVCVSLGAIICVSFGTEVPMPHPPEPVPPRDC
jgi:hypothetical protein